MGKKSTELVVKKRNFFQKLIDRIMGNSYNPETSMELINNTKKNDNFKKILKDTSRDDGEQRPHYRQENVAVSDLHGDMDRWKKIKKAMYDNPNMHVIMLGDATDRGKDGLEILLQIKELTEKGRMEYLPGNHDLFLYNYLRGKMQIKSMSENEQNSRVGWKINDIYRTAKKNMEVEGNGGRETLEKLKMFNDLVEHEIQNENIHKKVTIQELVNWLGKQPIQMEINENDTKYALAHSFFDKTLYSMDKEFNLEKAFQESLKFNVSILDHFNMTMWYREDDEQTHYTTPIFPEDRVMVVGHTKQKNGVNFVNFQGNENQLRIMIDNYKNEGLNLSTGKIICFEQERQSEAR